MNKREKWLKALKIIRSVIIVAAIAISLFAIVRNCVGATALTYYGDSEHSAIYIPWSGYVDAGEFDTVYPTVIFRVGGATIVEPYYSDGSGGYTANVWQSDEWRTEVLASVDDGTLSFEVYVYNGNTQVKHYTMDTWSGYYDTPPLLILYEPQNTIYTDTPFAHYVMQRIILFDAEYKQTFDSTYREGYEVGMSAGYNQGYTEGVTAGYENGQNDGRAESQSEAYWSGYRAGETAGYADGAADATSDTDNPWYQLINAVIFAPINAVVSLFDFQIFGINMLGVVKFLFTIAAVIVIMSLILRFKT